MKKKIAAILLCCLSCTLAFAQSPDEKEIANRVEELRKALLSPDKAVLEELAADKLTYGHSTGLIEDKAAFVDDLITGKTVFTSIDLQNQTISLSGDVGIVRHRMLAGLNNNNTPSKVDIIILSIWQKQKGKWKLLARQAAKVPEAK